MLDGKPFDLAADRLDLFAAGDTLIAQSGSTGLVRSTDQGRTWSSVELPRRRDTAHPLVLQRFGEAVVTFMSEQPAGPSHIWTTTDGEHWKGGEPLTLPETADGLTAVGGELPDGRLIIPLGSDDGPEQALVSGDDGSTWQVAPCPAVAAREEFGCMGLTPGGEGLWLTLHYVSLDEGRTWQRLKVAPDPEPMGDDQLRGIVPLAGGGWLGTVTDVVVKDGSLAEVRYVARSDDGLTWAPAIEHPCNGLPDIYGEGFSPPAALGDAGWVTAIDCKQAGKVARSELYRLGPDGRDPKLLDTLEDGSFGTPAASGDVVVVPETDGNELRIRRLQPTG